MSKLRLREVRLRSRSHTANGWVTAPWRRKKMCFWQSDLCVQRLTPNLSFLLNTTTDSVIREEMGLYSVGSGESQQVSEKDSGRIRALGRLSSPASLSTSITFNNLNIIPSYCNCVRYPEQACPLHQYRKWGLEISQKPSKVTSMKCLPLQLFHPWEHHQLHSHFSGL